MYRVFSLLIIASATKFIHCDDDKYPSTYDHIDVKAVLANDELREQYYDCFIERGPCVTPDQTFFQEFMPEVFATKCKKCTDKQKDAFDLIVSWYADNKPEAWDKLVEHFVKKAEAFSN